MRYFLTSNANRPYVVGAFSFTFEPVVIRGGSWLGVLAVEEDSAASALAASKIQQVEEITLEQYENVKKKSTAGPSNFPNFQTRPSGQGNPLVAAAVHAARPFEPPGAAASEPIVSHEAVTLLARQLNPPDEPLLAEVKGRKPFR